MNTNTVTITDDGPYPYVFFYTNHDKGVVTGYKRIASLV